MSMSTMAMDRAPFCVYLHRLNMPIIRFAKEQAIPIIVVRAPMYWATLPIAWGLTKDDVMTYIHNHHRPMKLTKAFKDTLAYAFLSHEGRQNMATSAEIPKYLVASVDRYVEMFVQFITSFMQYSWQQPDPAVHTTPQAMTEFALDQIHHFITVQQATPLKRATDLSNDMIGLWALHTFVLKPGETELAALYRWNNEIHPDEYTADQYKTLSSGKEYQLKVMRQKAHRVAEQNLNRTDRGRTRGRTNKRDRSKSKSKTPPPKKTPRGHCKNCKAPLAGWLESMTGKQFHELVTAHNATCPKK